MESQLNNDLWCFYRNRNHYKPHRDFHNVQDCYELSHRVLGIGNRNMSKNQISNSLHIHFSLSITVIWITCISANMILTSQDGVTGILRVNWYYSYKQRLHWHLDFVETIDVNILVWFNIKSLSFLRIDDKSRCGDSRVYLYAKIIAGIVLFITNGNWIQIL